MSFSAACRRAAAVALFCVAVALAAPAQRFEKLVDFNGTNGANPESALVQSTDGSLYGMTYNGGAYVGCYRTATCGTLFKISPQGTLTMLNSFCATTKCPLGGLPAHALILASDDNLYGTTTFGALGSGTVLKISGRKLTSIHSFCSRNGKSGCEDGYQANGLVQAIGGNFYGTTQDGGAQPNQGTIFKITESGTFTTLYDFCPVTRSASCPDGQQPRAGLIQAFDGNFYGTALGGANDQGTVFRITPSGVFTTLYTFCAQTNCTDGAEPDAALLQATDGDFYGTTYDGGDPATNAGTVFKMTPAGALTTIYTFCATTNCADGQFPAAELIQSTDGNFYGTTSDGYGSHRGGTVFKLTAAGALTTLYSFCSQTNCTDGAEPVAALVQATDGNFYGTTDSGGSNGDGTVYRISLGLSPFVKTVQRAGKVGSSVTILGTNLTGTTSVTFHGTEASFTIVSPTEITSTVPTGATTGKVQVVAASGTLLSNVAFRVF
jgi:uncharacterized repeat protein (TIGR03803 family)